MKYLRSISSIFFYTVIISLLPALLLIVFSAYHSGENTMEQSEQTLENTANLLADQNLQIIERTRSILMTLAKFKQIQNLDAPVLPDIFSNLTSISVALVDLRLCDLNGNTLASSAQKTVPLSAEQKAFLLKDIGIPEFAVQPSAISPTIGEPVLTCSYPVYSDKEYVAVIVASVKTQIDAQHLSDLKSLGNFDIKLIDRNNAIVFSKQNLNQSDEFFQNLFSQILQLPDDSGRISDHNDEGISVFYHKMRISNFNKPFLTIIISTDHENTLSQIHSLISQYSKILISLVVVASIITWLIFYLFFIRPTKQLRVFAESVKDGNMKVIFKDLPMVKELAVLTSAFNTMVQSLATRTSDLTLAQETAINASKAKSEFLANMSHEIRTPMNAILGMAYLTLRTNLTSQQKNYIGKIQSQAQELLEIINNILDFSKLEAGKTSIEHINFNLRNALKETLHIYKNQALEKGLSWQENFDKNIPPSLFGDPHHLSQILSTYLGNAVKYTEKGGVSFSCLVKEQQGKHISLLFEIVDTGAGLAPEQIAKYFPDKKAAESTKELTQGSLNLNLTSRLIQLLAGTLSVSSSPEQGTNISIELPFVVATSYSLAQLISTASATSPILVLNTPTIKYSQILPMLGELKAKTHVVEQPQDIVKALQNQDGQIYHLTIIDLNTSLQNKGELVRNIKELKLKTTPKIIMLCEGIGHEIGAVVENAGADFVLYCPFNQSTLFNTLQDALVLSTSAISLQRKKMSSLNTIIFLTICEF